MNKNVTVNGVIYYSVVNYNYALNIFDYTHQTAIID